MSRIWVGHHQLNGGQTWRFFATKHEGLAWVRAELDAHDGDPDEHVAPTVEAYFYGPGRPGVAGALNDFIEWTCLNEH